MTMTATDPELVRQVTEDVFLVTTHLETTRQGTRYGTLSHYRDDYITVELDNHDPNMVVTLANGDVVFDRQGCGAVQSFRPGHWVEYLHNLAGRALEVRQQRDTERRRARRQGQQPRFAPVDDARLFGDLAG